MLRVTIGLLVATWITGLAALYQAHSSGINAAAAASAARTAESTLKDQQKYFEIDQRAWVGVDNVVGVPTKGAVFNITVVIKNTGKTPAKNVHPWKRDEAHTQIPNVQANCKSGLVSGALKTSGFMNPGGVFFMTLNPSHGEPLQRELGDILKPGELLYVYGCVTYDDVFGAPHWLTYCSFWDEKAKGYDPCEKYNDAGDGAPPE